MAASKKILDTLANALFEQSKKMTDQDYKEALEYVAKLKEEEESEDRFNVKLMYIKHEDTQYSPNKDKIHKTVFRLVPCVEEFKGIKIDADMYKTVFEGQMTDDDLWFSNVKCHSWDYINDIFFEPNGFPPRRGGKHMVIANGSHEPSEDQNEIVDTIMFFNSKDTKVHDKTTEINTNTIYICVELL